MEDEVVNGWDEPRRKLRNAFRQAEILADLPPDPRGVDPFGPDPALLASMDRGDDAPYYAPTRWPAPPDPTLPAAPVDAAGR